MLGFVSKSILLILSSRLLRLEVLNSRFSTKGLICYVFLVVVLVTRWRAAITQSRQLRKLEKMESIRLTLLLWTVLVQVRRLLGLGFWLHEKKQVSGKGKKVSPRISQYRPAQHQKACSPNHATSPTHLEVDPSGVIQRENKHAVSPVSTDSAFLADHTQIKNKDKTNLYSAKIAIKQHSRNN